MGVLKTIYVLRCPACGREFRACGKHNVRYARDELVEHVLASHVDWLDGWLRQHGKNWRYVRRECVKAFGGRCAGVAGDGCPLVLSAPPGLLGKMRKARNLRELLDALDELGGLGSGPMERVAYAIQAEALRKWIAVYVLEKAGVEERAETVDLEDIARRAKAKLAGADAVRVEAEVGPDGKPRFSLVKKDGSRAPAGEIPGLPEDLELLWELKDYRFARGTTEGHPVFRFYGLEIRERQVEA